jgi:hypothetical protein
MSRIFLFALFILFSCNRAPEKNAIEKPDDLIPEEKMVHVLAEVHLLEGTLSSKTPEVTRPHGPITMELPKDTLIHRVTIDPNAAPPIGWYDIFKKYGVTKKQYISSMNWYCSQPETLNEIYDKVIEELTTRQLKERK